MSVSIKREANIDNGDSNTLQNVDIEIKSEKGPDIPTKSSMEILSELFSTFHAEPPLIIKKEDNEFTKSKHKKKKKHKHKEKKHKKSKKKHRSINNSSEEDSKGDLAELLIKQEKDLSTKRLRIQGTDLSLSLIQEEIQKEENLIESKTPEGSPQHKSNKTSKITIQDLKKSSVYETILKGSKTDCNESDGNIKSKHHKKKHKHKSKKRSRSSSKDRHKKKFKVDDLRDILNDKDSKTRKHRYSSKDLIDEYDVKDNYQRERSRDRNYDRDIFDKYKDEPDREIKKSRRENPFYKNYKDELSYRERDRRSSRDRYRDYTEKNRYRSRSTSRERDSSSKFDKKKLLEIARKNAIAMMKSGSLPAALTLGPQAQEKVIAAIRSGGKTIEELTDFCKTLSKKEELGELSSLSEKEDSDSDTDKPFHHPFQIRERPTTITLNIKNSVPLPVKSSLERSTELRIQFPVSSGQQHRKDEEWRPVSPPTASKNEKKVVPVIPQPVIPTSSIPLPPEPTPKPNVISVETEVQNTSQQLSIVTSNNTPSTQPFNILANGNVDLGTIVSQRLAAIRKLQENPNDVSALNQMYKSDKEMQTWASSKQAPLGQFRGSTGAQIMSQSELSSGYQAWAKKDQLQTAAPVSGGMGMHLLQKMGWKPGEGLGKEKTGSLEPLLLEVKLDKRGLVANEEQQKGKVRKLKAVPSVKNLQGKHPVSLLGEYASKKKIGAPQYILEFECGPDHKKNFLFKVVLNGVEYKPNIASNNKKEAKAAAASLCLQKIGLLPDPTTLPVPSI